MYALTCSNDCSIFKWDLTSERRIARSKGGHSDWVQKIHIFDEGIVSYGHDKRVFVWDNNLQVCKEINHSSVDWILCGLVIQEKDERVLITGDASGAIDTWDLVSQSHISNHVGYLDIMLDIRAFPLYENGKTVCAIASADGVIRIWEIESDRIIGLLEGHVGWVNNILSCREGSIIISCGSDKKVILHDIQNIDNYENLELLGHDDWVLYADSMDKDKSEIETFVTCSYDGSFIVWKIDKENYVSGIKYGGIKKSNNSIKYITVNEDEFPVKHEAGIKVIRQISKELIVTGGYDGKVILWNLSNPMQSKLVYEHSDWVRDISVTYDDSDNCNIISVGVDGKIYKTKIYDEFSARVYSINENLELANPLSPIDESKYIPFADIDYLLNGRFNKNIWRYIDKIICLKNDGSEFVALSYRGKLKQLSESTDLPDGFNLTMHDIDGVSNINNIVQYLYDKRIFICIVDNKYILNILIEPNQLTNKIEARILRTTEMVQGFGVVGVDFSKADFDNNTELKELLRKNGALV